MRASSLRNDINVIRCDPQVVGDFTHRHRSDPRQNLRQRALVVGVKMLHQHKSHARLRRQMLQQLGERVQPPLPTRQCRRWERPGLRFGVRARWKPENSQCVPAARDTLTGSFTPLLISGVETWKRLETFQRDLPTIFCVTPWALFVST